MEALSAEIAVAQRLHSFAIEAFVVQISAALAETLAFFLTKTGGCLSNDIEAHPRSPTAIERMSTTGAYTKEQSEPEVEEASDVEDDDDDDDDDDEEKDAGEDDDDDDEEEQGNDDEEGDPSEVPDANGGAGSGEDDDEDDDDEDDEDEDDEDDDDEEEDEDEDEEIAQPPTKKRK